MIRFALLLLMSLAVSSQAVAAVKWNNPNEKDIQNHFDFSKSISFYLSVLKETDKEVIKQFRENAEIINEELHFTLNSSSYQNKFDKEEVVNNSSRKQSQRSELRYTLSNPQNKSIKMSFKFKSQKDYQISHRVLLSQIKTLTTSKFRKFSHPNVAIYGENKGMVSCVEWHMEESNNGQGYHRKKINLASGYLTDGKWHDVIMEFIPNTDTSEGLCRVTVDGIVQIEMKGYKNLPHGLRKDKYHLNIGPYRDKVNEKETFIYDEWKVEVNQIAK